MHIISLLSPSFHSPPHPVLCSLFPCHYSLGSNPMQLMQLESLGVGALKVPPICRGRNRPLINRLRSISRLKRAVQPNTASDASDRLITRTDASGLNHNPNSNPNPNPQPSRGTSRFRGPCLTPTLGVVTTS